MYLLFVSCEKEAAELNVSIPSPVTSPSWGTPSNISFGYRSNYITLPPEATNIKLRISTNRSWNIAMPATWFQNNIQNSKYGKSYYAVDSNFWSSISAYSGRLSSDITLSVTENPSYHNREYKFLLNAGSLSKEITVQQLGMPYLEIEYPHYEVAATHGNFPLDVYVYDPIDINVESSNPEWIGWYSGGIVPVDDIVEFRMNISVGNNLSPTPREATLTFTQGNLTKIVTVRQAGAE